MKSDYGQCLYSQFTNFITIDEERRISTIFRSENLANAIDKFERPVVFETFDTFSYEERDTYVPGNVILF